MARERLITRLDRLTTAQITEVLGPVGAGKSSLVASWVADGEAVWLAAGHHHRLLEALLEHHGVAAVAADEDDAVAALENLPGGRAAAIVVVDDAHFLPAEAATLITRLATRAPLAARFVLVGRETVPLPGLPLDVAISTLPASELRFTDAEAEALVLALTPTVDDDSLSHIVREGHGWAAALVVGARTVGDDAGELAHPPAAGRLAVQVLAAIPPPVSTLLLATCDEESFDTAAALSLTGNPDTPRLLAELATDGLLLERGPTPVRRPESFRVNPVLRRALRETSGVGDAGHETRVRAHLRAATTLVRNQAELDLAVRHAILAEDPEVLLHVLRLHGHGLLEGGGKELLAQALDALPREERSTDPAVLVLESLLCRMTLRYDEAADLSLAAERAREDDPRHGTAEGDDLTLDMIALMRLWRSRCGWADPRRRRGRRP